MDADYEHREKAPRQLHKNATSHIAQNPRSIILKNCSCTATYFLSLKTSKSVEQDM